MNVQQFLTEARKLIEHDSEMAERPLLFINNQRAMWVVSGVFGDERVEDAQAAQRGYFSLDRNSDLSNSMTLASVVEEMQMKLDSESQDRAEELPLVLTEEGEQPYEVTEPSIPWCLPWNDYCVFLVDPDECGDKYRLSDPVDEEGKAGLASEMNAAAEAAAKDAASDGVVGEVVAAMESDH